MDWYTVYSILTVQLQASLRPKDSVGVFYYSLVVACTVKDARINKAP